MKKNYIQPLAETLSAEHDLDLMIKIGSDGVDDGFAKEREEYEEAEIEAAMNNQKDNWHDGLW